MSKFKVNIRSLSEEEMKKELLEISNIMIGLRFHTKYWLDHFGSINRKKMNYWENKADEWIEKYKVITED